MKKITLLFSFVTFSFFLFSQTSTFNYTGAVQTFVVPAFVTSVNADVLGAGGSLDGSGSGIAGKGGRVQASLIVTPGETLYVYVGGAGAAPLGGFNGGGHGGTSSIGPAGGGGGGMSDIRQGGNLLSDIVIAAAGGGGCGGYNGVNGGNAGGLTGLAGTNGAATGGGGGTQISGGLAGTGAGNCGLAGTAGIQWMGGTGGNTTCGNGFGGGGGGGAGYFGGGGGGAAAYLACCPDWSGGGGGGSSYVDSSVVSSITHTAGYQSGNGQITISYIITAIDEVKNIDDRISLSPNPVTNELKIQNAELKIKNVEIYNVFGELVLKQQTTNDKQQTFNVSQLPSGIYFLRIMADKAISAKFVKE